jgi:hypothetical protein
LAFYSGREADHSPPSNAEVKEWVELYLHSPNTLSWRGAQLGGAQGTTLTSLSSPSNFIYMYIILLKFESSHRKFLFENFIQKCVKGFRVSETNSESERTRGT